MNGWLFGWMIGWMIGWHLQVEVGFITVRLDVFFNLGALPPPPPAVITELKFHPFLVLLL
jgi:hypothetical protein